MTRSPGTIYEKLNESLITPLEPEEISRLAPVMDDVLDRIDRVTQQICNYGMTEQNDKLREFSYMILLASAEIAKAYEKLPNMEKIRGNQESCKRDQPAVQPVNRTPVAGSPRTLQDKGPPADHQTQGYL